MSGLNNKVKHVVDHKPLTRRKFLRIMSVFFFLFLLRPVNYSYASSRKRKKVLLASRNLIRGKFEFFTQYQVTVVDEFVSLIIPTDEESGAKEAGVVFELDRVVVNSHKLKELYKKGIEWLDYMAEKISNKVSFLDLSDDEKIMILRIADSDKSSYLHKILLFIKYRHTRTARRFFNKIKRQTFEVFYTSEIGWKVVGYQGPPQWSGHLDYHKCT